jgi:hypothetical protein
MSKPHYDREHHVKKATGIGDPQCFKGEAPAAKFKVLVYESPPAEDESWDNTENVEWFYSLVFKMNELWPNYPDVFSDDTVETEIPEHYLEAC